MDDRIFPQNLEDGASTHRGRRTISILIPNYNHAQYLAISLKAICEQTRPADEILVLDDGSGDNSVAIIEAFAREHRNIRVLRNEDNRGLQFSINRLLREARGDYIACAAADDMLMPEFIAESMALLERYPAAGMCCSEFVVIDAAGRLVNFSREQPKSYGLDGLPEYLPPAALAARFAESYLWMSSNTVVVRRDAVIKAGGFICELEWHSDWFAFYAIALRHGVCPIRAELAAIRENRGGYSDSGIHDWGRQLQVLVAIADALARQPNRDLRGRFRRYPGLLGVFGFSIAAALVRTPRHWDLLLSYCVWYVRKIRRERNLNWLNMIPLVASASRRVLTQALRSGSARPDDTRELGT